jgi:hypothetical protein
VENFYQSEVFKIRFKENNKDRKLLKKRMNEKKKDRKENDT